MSIPSIFKKLWLDPVWSKVIATAIIALVGAIHLQFSGSYSNKAVENQENVKPDTLASQPIQGWPPLTVESIKNLTYKIEGDDITLQNGKREFNPDYSSGIQDEAVFAYLTEYAFGDLDGDGNSDAIAILEVTYGGSGIFYYLVPVFNNNGSPAVYGSAYELGDRLVFRTILIRDGKLTMQLMMHKPEDSMCCPSLFRTLEFSFKNRTLQCNAESCSDST
jgi:hypothetical protein